MFRSNSNSFWYLRGAMKQTKYISVILPLKLEWEPCYSVPEEILKEGIKTGDRVRVPFSGKEYIGVVSSADVAPETDPRKIKDIFSVERDMERVLPQEIELWRKVAEYYLCTVGEVSKAAYPTGKLNLEEARANAISKVRLRKEKLAESIRTKIERLEARLARKKEAAAKARKESTRMSYLEETRALEDEISMARTALEAVNREPHADLDGPKHQEWTGITLTEAQKKAFGQIKDGFASDKPVLLDGVTGSGKTEIYMMLAHEVLSEGRNVLYLVPEIALSRQLEDRLHAYFGERLITFHSGESASSRRNAAEQIRRMAGGKDNYIVLGTRSSIFLPHHDLGLIIVDEEHDNSYKQDSPAPRYNGRDTALMMHQIHGCKILLGSATPSLEELYNCSAGKHVLVTLSEKYHGSEDADIEIIDTKAERRKNGMTGNFSRRLIEHINRTLESGEQVIILRSRRSWAPVMQCETCGEIVRCPHCNVSLCLHKHAAGGRMTCHYCGFSSSFTGRCGKCGGNLNSLGAGTQKIEEEAAKLFPHASIARLDGDTAQNKSYETRTIKDFAEGKTDILIGTQIVTKGFDFKGLNLVAVIAADALLGMQDFRADEKALQTLEQFRGRCGRRGSKGMFVIQTSQPEHPVYRRLMEKDGSGNSRELMLERKDFNFPPFSRIIEITVKDRFEDRADRMSARLAADLRELLEPSGCPILQSMVTGPYAPVVDKVADMHIRSIRLSLKKDRNLASSKSAIMAAVHKFEKSQKYDGHITINVDPS